MQARIPHLKKQFVFVLMCTMIFWTQNGHAFEPWHAETTAGVNLRASFGLDGKVIVGIKKGETGLITAENNGWYQIKFDYGGYGYTGWVYGKYLKRVQDKSKIGYAIQPKKDHLDHVSDSKVNKTPSKSRLSVKQPEEKQPKEISESVLENSISTGRYKDDKNKPVRVVATGESRPVETLEATDPAEAKPSTDLNQNQKLNSFSWVLVIGSSITLFCFTILFFYKTTRSTEIAQEPSTPHEHKTIEPKKAPVKEKRLHPRKSRLVEVDFVVQDRVYWGSIRNISTGGAYIETLDPFTSGQKIVLTFPSPGSQEHLKKTGEIIWTDANGIGVKFKETPKPVPMEAEKRVSL